MLNTLNQFPIFDDSLNNQQRKIMNCILTSYIQPVKPLKDNQTKETFSNLRNNNRITIQPKEQHIPSRHHYLQGDM